MATKIARTGTSSTNATKFTWSAWVKRANIGGAGVMYYNYLDGNNRGYLIFDSNDNIFYYDKDGGDEQANLTTTAKYKDCNAFYHICLIGDSTDGTQGDRIQLYVNGVRQTMTGTYPDQNDSLGTKVHTGTNYHAIGTNADSTSNPFSGIISHVHYVDGIDYPATTFGSTDATTGEWKINTSPSITTSDYGNNGYFVLKDGNSVTDQSGNSHNFTVTAGTLTKTLDCPSNIFATWNPLWSASNGNVGDVAFSNGNLTTTTSASYRTTPTTLGMKDGKFYWEIKRIEYDGTDTHFGVMSEMATPANTATWIGSQANGWVIAQNGQPYTGNTGGSIIANASFQANGDIMMGAYDGTTGKLYFGVNGTWGGTANPSTGANPHYTLDTSKFYFPCVSTGNDVSANFGNGYFGTTAITTNSGNGYAGAEGKSKFNYQPPTGFSALTTRGLNQ